MSRIYRALVTGDADRRSVLAGHRVAAIAMDLNYFNDAIDLVLRCAGLHYYEHKKVFPVLVTKTKTLKLGIRFCKLRHKAADKLIYCFDRVAGDRIFDDFYDRRTHNCRISETPDIRYLLGGRYTKPDRDRQIGKLSGSFHE